MSHDDKLITRRQLLKSTAAVGVAVAGAGWALGGCGDDEGFSCTDTSGLSAQELQTRTSLKYVDKSPYPEKTCSNCQLFQSKGAQQCGTCTVVKGPIHPQGYCTSWAAKSA